MRVPEGSGRKAPCTAMGVPILRIMVLGCHYLGPRFGGKYHLSQFQDQNVCGNISKEEKGRPCDL